MKPPLSFDTTFRLWQISNVVFVIGALTWLVYWFGLGGGRYLEHRLGEPRASLVYCWWLVLMVANAFWGFLMTRSTIARMRAAREHMDSAAEVVSAYRLRAVAYLATFGIEIPDDAGAPPAVH